MQKVEENIISGYVDPNPLEDFIKPGKVSVIIDGQYGSTGKGLIAAYVAMNVDGFSYAITNASANAGHTTVIGDRKFTTFHLPTSAVINEDSFAVIDAGAIIDPDILFQELEEHNMWDRVFIHPNAAVILPEHTAAEKASGSSTSKIGSTQKGVGAALADKIARRGNVAALDQRLRPFVREITPNEFASCRGSILEVPQGFSLGVNSGGFYPYCTSRDVTPSQAMSDAGLHPSFLHKTLMCVRTYPIRVGNIYDENGKMVGWSGPSHANQKELEWEKIGVEPELTTVTKRPRRIFDFSMEQYRRSLEYIRPDLVFLNFCNYLDKNQVRALSNQMDANGKGPDLLGYGPDVSDVIPRPTVNSIDFQLDPKADIVNWANSEKGIKLR